MKHSGAWHPRLEEEQPYLWLPDTSTSVVGTGLGPAWASGAPTVTHPTPTASYIGQWRRTRFANTGIADQELGVHLANADHAHVWLGTVDTSPNPDHYRGGFYFSCIFRINARQGANCRLFIGYSGSNTPLCLNDTPLASSVGLWCASTDSMVASLLCVNAAGTATPAGLSGAPALAVGNLYRWVMMQSPTANSIVTQLYDLSTEANGGLISATNAGVSTLMATSMAVLMAPQAGFSNASNVGVGANSFDIMSIYSRPHLRYRAIS